MLPLGMETEVALPYLFRFAPFFYASAASYLGHRNFSFFDCIVWSKNESFLLILTIATNLTFGSSVGSFGPLKAVCLPIYRGIKQGWSGDQIKPDRPGLFSVSTDKSEGGTALGELLKRLQIQPRLQGPQHRLLRLFRRRSHLPNCFE